MVMAGGKSPLEGKISTMETKQKGVEVRIAYKAFAPYITEEDPHDPITTVTVNWEGAEDLSDEQVCEAVFHQTNTYRGALWNLIEPLLSPRRTHTAVSVGDEVTVRGITYRCESVGWQAVAVEIAAHEAFLDERLGRWR